MAGRPWLRFVEVGVFEGRASVWLLRNVLTHATARLDCIDPFEWSSGQGRPHRSDMGAVRRRFLANIVAIGAEEKVRLIEQRSDVALCLLPIQSYDCVYVDGSHHSADVLVDAVLAYRLLKPRGLLIFDDYDFARAYGTRPGLADPKEGIDAFARVYRRRVEVVDRGYQLALRRIGP